MKMDEEMHQSKDEELVEYKKLGDIGAVALISDAKKQKYWRVRVVPKFGLVTTIDFDFNTFKDIDSVNLKG